MAMVWKILRPSYWILDRKIRATNRFIVLGAIMLVLYGGQWFYDNLLADQLALLNSDLGVTLIVSLLPMGISLLLLFAMLGLGDVIHILYRASDLEILMAAPLPYRTIFLVKLLQCSRASFFPALAFGAPLLALGAAQGASPFYYLLVGVLILAGMALATSLAMSLAIALARWFSPEKLWTGSLMAVMLFSFAFTFVQRSSLDWFAEQSSELAVQLSAALHEPGRLIWFGVVVVGLAGAAGLGAYQVFALAFYGGWNRQRVVAVKPAKRRRRGSRRGWLAGIARRLPEPVGFIVVKEWLDMRRDTRRLIGLFIYPLILVPLAWQLLSAGNVLRPMAFWFLLFFSMAYGPVNPVMDAMLSVGREGRDLELLKGAPISMNDVLKGKFWGTAWTFSVVIWGILLTALGLLMNLAGWQIILLMASMGWTLIVGTAMNVPYGAIVADFTVDDPAGKSVAILPAFLSQGAGIIFLVLNFATVAWLVVRLFPESEVALPLLVLSGLSQLGWLRAEGAGPLLALLAGHGLFIAGAWALRGAAVRRLEQWEA